MSISLPLDSTACTQADDVFYCANRDTPSVWDAAGNRVPLSADDPAQEPLRDYWCDLYEDILAHNRDGSAPFPSCGTPGHVHHPVDCPHCAAPGVGDGDDAPSTDPVDGDPVDPVEGCPCEEEGPPTIRLRVTMFFDGTRNNRDNVSSHDRGDDSYQAGYSNIAKLEWAGVHPAEALTEHILIYVEGIGTVTGGADDSYGNATGEGSTGVLAKVQAGYDAALARIRAAADAAPGQEIEYVHVDAFGFSRGAAAARNFIHQSIVDPSTALRTRLTMAGYTVGEVTAKFVGLFDTVASFGALSHADDTAQLKLDAIAQAERVVQLAAAEEHRVNFRLTNIESAGGHGTEIYLPGVHSDVGGGYADTSDEIDIQLFDIHFPTDTPYPYNTPEVTAALEREKRWLVETGWYEEVEGPNLTNELTASRYNLSNTYSRIPLRLMAEYARRAGLQITGQVESQHPIPDELLEAMSEIRAAIQAGGCGSASRWFSHPQTNSPYWHRMLRRRHLHTSSYYGAQDTSGVYENNKPRFDPDKVYGVRRRVVNRG